MLYYGMVKNSFGTNLRYYRKLTGMTQQKLGSKLGITQVTIANYENDSRFPNEEILRRLSEELYVSIGQLMEPNPSENMSSDKISYDIDSFIRLLLNDSIDNNLTYLQEWKINRGMYFESMIFEVFIPLLKRVGCLWNKRELIIAEEHLISEKIRDLICRLSSNEIIKKNIKTDKSKIWMGVCAPAEKHDLMLYMLNMILKQHGWTTYFLGKELPLNDLKKMIELKKTSVLVFSITLTEHRNGLDAYLEQLSETGLKIIVGGSGANTEFCKNISDKIEYAETLETAVSKILEK